jgi:leucyl aminopeptidase (aminopeptidase T)
VTEPHPADTPERLARFAALAVRAAANVQPGQLVAVDAAIEQHALARAIAREAYAAGARCRGRRSGSTAGPTPWPPSTAR